MPGPMHEPIAEEELSDTQRELLDRLRGEGAEIKAAINQLIAERGFPLEVVSYELGPPRGRDEVLQLAASGRSIAADDVILFEGGAPHPPPGGGYYYRDGAWNCS